MPAATHAMQSGEEPFENASGAKGMPALSWVQTIWTRPIHQSSVVHLEQINDSHDVKTPVERTHN